MCTEGRLLNFATINMIFSSIMIVAGIWDTVAALSSKDNGRWHNNVWYGIADVVSIILGIETLVIHFKFPQLVFTDDQIGARPQGRNRQNEQGLTAW